MTSMYVRDESGATFIPATQRPDGTWRKARRVKEGYVPQEEVPLYESKGKQWAKGRPDDLPVGMSREDSVKMSQTSQTKDIVGLSKAAKKSAKKKEKKKSQNNEVNKELCNKLNNTQISDGLQKKKTGTQPIATDPIKRLKNMKKKLREIEVLKSKIESGELANPDKDQLDKISRRDLVEKEIEDLELLIDE